MGRLKDALFILTVAVAIVIGGQSCTGNVVYDTYNHTQLTGWDRSDTLFFNVPPMAAAGRYRQEVGLRISGYYPFKGLTLVVDQIVEPGHRMFTDTLKCRFTDDKGNSLGQGVSYSQYDFKVSELNLNKGDSLHVAVRHIMRREVLPGIADIGIRMSRIQ